MNSLLLALVLLQGAHTERTETRALEFEYAWPAAANRIPALRARLRAERNAAFTRASADAARDARERRRGGHSAMGHSYAKSWAVAGDNPALLSLIATENTFTGGAHGMQRLTAMLWDRARGRAVSARDALGRATLAGLRGRYCARLDAMRVERRGGEAIRREPGDPFGACPPLAAQVLAPADGDGDGRFDTLCILFSPYDVGSYAEGPYPVEVPFARGDLAAIPAAWRPRFEAGPARPRTACSADD